ncbi:MAG: PIN domain-containing protein [Nitrospira sp.]|nr:PIN domain-containing protein [Nitrospira sp.]MDR4463447.1 PIN domain-containing protein [Nitrospira sp.]
MAHLRLSGRLYLDTNIFIYALEGYSTFRAVLTSLFDALDRHELAAITSELTLAEVLVKPFLDRSIERERAYLQILQPSASLQIVPVTRDVLITAARLRAETNMKLPDAIHAATAQITACSHFLTNDAQVKTIPGLTILSLTDL